MSGVDEVTQAVQGAAQAAMKTAVALAPDSWIPGGKPDPLIAHKHGLIGTQVSRLDGPLKVKGEARFAAEVPMEGLTFAALAFSTIAKGRIATLDTSIAEAAPGVVLVMTHRNAPKMEPIPLFGAFPLAAGGGDGLPIMQDDRIRWNGEPIALVLAETQEQADHAASLIAATYEAEPAITDFVAAQATETKPAAFQGEPLRHEKGDAEAALAAAPFKIDHLYRTPRHTHNAIEPHAATIVWDGDTLRVHDASQAVVHAAWSLGHIFGLEVDRTHVTSPFVGGGFGSKMVWRHQVLGAAAARLAKRPVRIALSREGVNRLVGGRTLTEQRVALGAEADGRLRALIHEGVVAMPDGNVIPEPFVVGSQSAYAAESVKLDVRTTHVDMLANTFMRAPGEAPGTFALESAIDELAHAIGMDPIELRVRNDPEKDPHTGLEFSQRGLIEAYRTGAERFGWSERSTAPGTRREGEWLIGTGVATGTYPYYRMPGGAARLTIDRDGTATVAVAAHEMGMGTSTTTAIVAADRLGLPIDQITVEQGDSTLPGKILAGGSQQTASIGAAVAAAHAKLVAELLRLAGNDSPLAGLTPDEVGGFESGLASLDDPTRYESYTSILSRAQQDRVSAVGDASQPLELGHWSMHSTSALFCEVRVNAVTGETRVSRFLGAFDCGRILNAKTAASQFRGGIIMGLGMALMEETQFDERNGRIIGASLAEYHIPAHMDVPEIEVMWTDIPDPHTPMGARGVGEIGITGVAAAVANAVFNATGTRVRTLPITLDKLL